jgi:hypothetical protein
MSEKEHWRLLLDPPPLTEGKWRPHQQDLVWIGADVWRRVTPPNPEANAK